MLSWWMPSRKLEFICWTCLRATLVLITKPMGCESRNSSFCHEQASGALNNSSKFILAQILLVRSFDCALCAAAFQSLAMQFRTHQGGQRSCESSAVASEPAVWPVHADPLAIHRCHLGCSISYLL